METNNKPRILVVDDEADICEVLKFNLENEGYFVETAPSAEAAFGLLPGNFRLILLDVMMGGMSGFRLAQKAREEGNTTPIVFLTAKDTENDMLTGFSVGGDDYIAKPFSIKEVIARIKAILRREAGKEASPDAPAAETIAIGDLEMNLQAKQLCIARKAIVLTKKEFEILALLMKNPERVYTREEILNQVWQKESFVLDRTVDVHIARLRRKMGSHGARIANRTGYGYCFNR
ncbi:MAG: response regulator transcription factor [Dysgonamonadaceae bacterium]|jgi:two-component system alkaline phosphatase synthesis response regulator PhoP|nr:response regulator transcription factor [Dysgonamonadaceae bacterium]